MLSDTQTLSSDCATDVDTSTQVYVRQYGDSGSSAFSVAGLTLPSNIELVVSHDVTKAGNVRHLVSENQTVVDSNLVPATSRVYLVIDRPPSTAISVAVVIAQVNRLIDFLIEGGSNANVTKILNNEV